MVTTKGHRFRMHPVESRTGAIRLEDPKRGAMWLQLGNKSMLMSQKLGQRLADECQSPEQLTYAETLKKNPLPSILESTPASPGSTSKSGAQLSRPNSIEWRTTMLQAYVDHVAERAALGIPPLPLSAKQTAELIELLKAPADRRGRLPAEPDHAPRAGRRRRRRQGQGQLPRRRGARHREVPGHQPRKGDRAAGHHAGRLQHQPADRPAGRRRGRRRRGRRPEEDPADVRPVPRRPGKGRQGQRQRQGRAAKLGRRRVVHQPPGSAAKHHGHASSRSPAKPTPTTCRRRPTPGAARTSRCTRWRC